MEDAIKLLKSDIDSFKKYNKFYFLKSKVSHCLSGRILLYDLAEVLIHANIF